MFPHFRNNPCNKSDKAPADCISIFIFALMYIPSHFKVEDFELQASIIKQFPLGVLVSSHQGFFSHPSINASHIPFFLKVDEETGKKYLIGHLDAKNHQVEQLEKSGNCLTIFQSQDSYISPSWYPSKKITQKLVPTWDFAAVYVSGKPKIIRDKDWLLMMLNEITHQEEGKRPEGAQFEKKWKVSDAPEPYINSMLRAIVGIEIEIEGIEAKFKFSQDKKPIDAKGIVENLEAEVKGDKAEYMINAIKNCHPNNIMQ